MKKIMLTIPDEFEGDFDDNRFHEFFGRTKGELRHQTNNPDGIGIIFGNYEVETMRMLEQAFDEAEVVKDEPMQTIGKDRNDTAHDKVVNHCDDRR